MARPQHWPPMEATEKIKIGELREIKDRWQVEEASMKKNRRRKVNEKDLTIGELEASIDGRFKHVK